MSSLIIYARTLLHLIGKRKFDIILFILIISLSSMQLLYPLASSILTQSHITTDKDNLNGYIVLVCFVSIIVMPLFCVFLITLKYDVINIKIKLIKKCSLNDSKKTDYLNRTIIDSNNFLQISSAIILSLIMYVFTYNQYLDINASDIYIYYITDNMNLLTMSIFLITANAMLNLSIMRFIDLLIFTRNIFNNSLKQLIPFNIDGSSGFKFLGNYFIKISLYIITCTILQVAIFILFPDLMKNFFLRLSLLVWYFAILNILLIFPLILFPRKFILLVRKRMFMNMTREICNDIESTGKFKTYQEISLLVRSAYPEWTSSVAKLIPLGLAAVASTAMNLMQYYLRPIAQ